MICGASKRKITPPAHLLPDLHGLGNVVFADVLDDIYVRVLLLGDGKNEVLFVVFDLDKVPYPDKYLPALSEQVGIPQENISLLSIHTHTAPMTGWRPTEGPNFILRKPEQVQQATHAYEAILEQTVREAVAEAMANRRSVRMGWGEGASYININRLPDYLVRREDGTTEAKVGLGQNPAAEVDRRLFVLKLEDIDGKMVACLTNYAVHNCVMIGNRCGKDGGTLLSSDLGGNVSRLIEENHPGCVALWTSGAAGDVNPILSNEILYPDPVTGAQKSWQLPAGDSAPIMMLNVLSARHYADILRVLERITCGEGPAAVGGMARWMEMPGKGNEPYTVRVHLTKLGEWGLWGFNGELYSSLGRALEGNLPTGNHLILNHDASLLAATGYIYDDDILLRDREETLPGRRNNNMLPGCVRELLLTTTASMWDAMQ